MTPTSSKIILGISAFYHDSAAALIQGSEIIAAAQEERFSRKRHDSSFPIHAIKFCLDQKKIDVKNLDFIVFYDKPLLKFERILETYISSAPMSYKVFIKSMPIWLKNKLFIKSIIKREISQQYDLKSGEIPEILFSRHHLSHAGSAYYPSPFPEAAVLCLDGVGEWETSTAWHGKQQHLQQLWRIDYPHSLGLLYSAFTYYLGFKVNSGEYKVMGLSPYGENNYVNLIYDNLIEVKQDGSYKLNTEYFGYISGLKMTNHKFHKLFGAPPRTPESQISRKEMDIAKSLQTVVEDIVVKMAIHLHNLTGSDNLCMAGGVALNCVANSKVRDHSGFKNIWIQPASGDAGGALGAALSAFYLETDQPHGNSNKDAMQGSYLGPSYSTNHISEFLQTHQIHHSHLDDESLLKETARHLANGKIVGWFQGKMEYGPRALGNRSILADPRSHDMQRTLNLKIKNRESFRPFAPSVCEDDLSQWFNETQTSPYMLFVSNVPSLDTNAAVLGKNGFDRLKSLNSAIPAVTHVDYSARVQTVTPESNLKFYKLLKAFKNETSCPVLVNTSFNQRGEPIVCTPLEAYQCFLRTDIDILVLENFIIKKSEQDDKKIKEAKLQKFELD